MNIKLTDTEKDVLTTTCNVMYADLSEERVNRAFICDLSEKDNERYDTILDALINIIGKLEKEINK